MEKPLRGVSMAPGGWFRCSNERSVRGAPFGLNHGTNGRGSSLFDGTAKMAVAHGGGSLRSNPEAESDYFRLSITTPVRIRATAAPLRIVMGSPSASQPMRTAVAGARAKAMGLMRLTSPKLRAA